MANYYYYYYYFSGHKVTDLILPSKNLFHFSEDRRKNAHIFFLTYFHSFKCIDDIMFRVSHQLHFFHFGLREHQK